MTDDKEELKIITKEQFDRLTWGHPFTGIKWNNLKPIPKHTDADFDTLFKAFEAEKWKVARLEVERDELKAKLESECDIAGYFIVKCDDLEVQINELKAKVEEHGEIC